MHWTKVWWVWWLWEEAAKGYFLWACRGGIGIFLSFDVSFFRGPLKEPRCNRLTCGEDPQFPDSLVSQIWGSHPFPPVFFGRCGSSKSHVRVFVVTSEAVSFWSGAGVRNIIQSDQAHSGAILFSWIASALTELASLPLVSKTTNWHGQDGWGV